jgi:hypothetical protein
VSEAKAVRDLRREYRRRRGEILEDPELSWEAKMRATKELFERFRERQAELEAEIGGVA